jgi:hypothetical protein
MYFNFSLSVFRLEDQPGSYARVHPAALRGVHKRYGNQFRTLQQQTHLQTTAGSEANKLKTRREMELRAVADDMGAQRACGECQVLARGCSRYLRHPH